MHISMLNGAAEQARLNISLSKVVERGKNQADMINEIDIFQECY